MKLECPFSPRENFVVLDRGEAPERIGSVVLPQQSQIKMDKGIVLAIGPGWYQAGQWLTVKHLEVGDVAHFAFGTGIEIEVQGRKLYIIPSQNIIGTECLPDT